MIRLALFSLIGLPSKKMAQLGPHQRFPRLKYGEESFYCSVIECSLPRGNRNESSSPHILLSIIILIFAHVRLSSIPQTGNLFFSFYPTIIRGL